MKSTFFQKITPSLLAVFLLTSGPSAFSQALWTAGHGDIGVGYEDEGGGFELHPHWHMEGGTVDGTPRADEEFDSGSLVLVVPNIPNALATRNASAIWDPIGVGAGETFWRISSNSQAGVPYLGWATEELDETDWLGDITFTLSGLVAPGDLSLYYFPDGELTFLWASSDGLSGGDAFLLSPGVHEHYNVAFSAPGFYEVEITVSGTHVTDGFQSATQTFGFNVVPEPSSALLLTAGLGILGLVRRRP